MFPIVPIPAWLATSFPMFFSAEIHQGAATVPPMLSMVLAYAYFMVALRHKDRNQFILALIAIVFGLSFLLFGAYALVALLFGLLVWAIVAITNHVHGWKK